MPIQIFDAGSSLKIIRDDFTRNIMKAHIRELSVVSDTILKFHTSTCLHHILIPFEEVTSPITANVNLLRDFINDNWLLPPAPAAPPPAPPPAILTDQYNKLVEMSGVMANQYNVMVDQFNKSEAMRLILADQFVRLGQISTIMDKIRLETELFKEPMVIDDTDPETVYYGYALPGTLETDPVWAIRRLVISPLGVSSMWANGNKNFTNVWALRATIVYI